MLFLVVLFETAHALLPSVPFVHEYAFEIVLYLVITADALVLAFAALALADSFPYVMILAGREALHDLLVILPLLFGLKLVLEIVIHTFLQKKKQNSSEFCF
ncbi:Uncharacterised protein [Streptococcus pneumoniae]|nr:Uncharacterised protein [Streptococcus pneumoniae]CJD10932.1 Uncharacterised protein [Streptococcus pneumoniae]CJH86613.1 Uncharacterised protein [Streptococcus pneumoniae]CJI89682.1 Uncharacterised protein [Streptococcus pneumoniae]CJI90625.1 Uncharacterised protein [Streptococcus pneumoniae]